MSGLSTRMAAMALLTALLSACASAPAPLGAQVEQQRLLASAVPGQTTRAQLLASLGATTKVVFESGYESWLYQAREADGQYTEWVVLLDPRGVVSKVRRGATLAPQKQ